MSPTTDKNLLLGSTTKIAGSGGHQPDKNALRTPFLDRDSVSRVFCENCGTYLEITSEGTKKLIELSKNPEMTNISDKYFHAKKCVACAETFENVEIKEI